MGAIPFGFSKHKPRWLKRFATYKGFDSLPRRINLFLNMELNQIRRLIKHIPVIVHNFKTGVPITVLANQMDCDESVIEEVIRLGFVSSFQMPKLEPIDE